MYRRLIIVLIFLLPFRGLIKAQSGVGKGFLRASCPEKTWAIFHPFIACKAWRITKETRLVCDSLLKDSIPDADPNGGNLDAFRHAYWMARLSQEMKVRKALKLGVAHEKGNYKDFLKGRKEEGQRSDSLMSVMDLHNNTVGSDIGIKYSENSARDIVDKVLKAIKDGKMLIVLKNEYGQALDCNGVPLSGQYPAHQWHIPKCLVPSGNHKNVK